MHGVDKTLILWKGLLFLPRKNTDYNPCCGRSSFDRTKPAYPPEGDEMPENKHDDEIEKVMDSWGVDPSPPTGGAPLEETPAHRAVQGKRKSFLPEVDMATPVHRAPLVVHDERGAPYHLASGQPLTPSVHQDLKGAPEGAPVVIPPPPRSPTFGVGGSHASKLAAPTGHKLAAPTGQRQPPPRAQRTSAASSPTHQPTKPAEPRTSEYKTHMGDAFGPAAATFTEEGSMSVATADLIEPRDLPVLARSPRGVPKLTSLQATLAPSDEMGRVDPERAAAMVGIVQNQPFQPFSAPAVAGAIPGAFGKQPGPFGRLQPPPLSTTEYSPVKAGFVRKNLHWIVIAVVLVTLIVAVASALSTTSAYRRIERLNTQPPVVVAPQPPTPAPPPVRQPPPVVRPPAPLPAPVVQRPAPTIPQPVSTFVSARRHCGVREDGQPDGQATHDCCLLPETAFRQIQQASAALARGHHGVWVRTHHHQLQPNAGTSLMVCGREPHNVPVAWLP